MLHYNFKSLLLVLAIFTLASCSKNEMPFEALDVPINQAQVELDNKSSKDSQETSDNFKGPCPTTTLYAADYANNNAGISAYVWDIYDALEAHANCVYPIYASQNGCFGGGTTGAEQAMSLCSYNNSVICQNETYTTSDDLVINMNPDSFNAEDFLNNYLSGLSYCGPNRATRIVDVEVSWDAIGCCVDCEDEVVWECYSIGKDFHIFISVTYECCGRIKLPVKLLW